MASITTPATAGRSSAGSTAGGAGVVERGADSFSLLAGVSGILWILLLVGPLFGFGLGPSPTSGPGDVAAYYAQHAGVLQRIQVLRACSTFFFLVFLAGLGDVLRRQARSAAPALGVLAAGVSVAGIGLVQYAARQAIALNATQLQDPAVVQTIRDVTNALDTFSAFPLAVLVGLTSWVLSGSRGGARWIGRAGLLIAVLLVVGGVGALSEFLRPLGAAGFLVSSAWLLVVAASLLGRGVQARRLAMAR